MFYDGYKIMKEQENKCSLKLISIMTVGRSKKN